MEQRRKVSIISKINRTAKTDEKNYLYPQINAKNDNYPTNNNNLQVIDITVNGKACSVKYNTRVSDLLVTELPCGGHGKCGKCKVKAFGDVSPLTESEKKHLTEKELKNGVRLSCNTFILGKCSIEKITENNKASVLTAGARGEIRLNPTFKKLGVAIDIGTTTVAAKLILPNGETLAECGTSNPQSVFGADVISRIEASLAGNGTELSSLIKSAIDRLIATICADAERDVSEIDGIAVTGNTVMLYLLTNTSPEPLSHAPFTLTRAFNESLKASELGLSSVSPDTEIYLPPCVSAFVGADTVCAIIAADLCGTAFAPCGKSDVTDTSDGLCDKTDGITDFSSNTKTAMLADIGTNGEMALWHSGKLYVCSTAAGPAFEGVGISMGMRGEKGAIDKVALVNGKPEASVIGGGTPVGICGSGLVDAVAALLDTEELDETGALEDEEVTILAPVTLTAKDIRMVQLAKSAINAGLCTLMNEANIDENDVSSLFIAGGFGNYLNKVSAGRIGLLPSKLVNKTENIGNAALIGAEMLLLNKETRFSAEGLSKGASLVELSTNKYFSESFISGMLF